MAFPLVAYGTPRKLPKPASLKGRVVVLDVAFAAQGAGGVSFERTTKPFIDGLGERLAMWIDHHDHQKHALYANDPRFVLRTKAEHGACPEMVTPALVERAGPIDTICCHTDFDGLCAAAKWIRGGIEPYAGADADAHAIDTRLGPPSDLAAMIDKALRGKPTDEGLRGLIVRFLAEGASDKGLLGPIEEAAAVFRSHEEEARRLALDYRVENDVALVDASKARTHYDKTLLLLLGQERATISLVYDKTTVTAAARFDSGVDLLEKLGLEGGMPTRVSVSIGRLGFVLERLHVKESALSNQ
ncbi:MAG TPA: hypothetical protein VMF89_14140 [Polyangiales bacterium]|nr:hypothetical protein [Polyangiales bacterium]